ncbi:MAG: AbrB/MazE/SpoVT family DNA-binding domain-containing protein [Clostridium sp.]|uniref:AbrB/MazE/SpoVT family DNA-binding domain-containing protein n=1 Tax=Clostridium sp. TaxID=1506 RepID=UPI003EE7A8B2
MIKKMKIQITSSNTFINIPSKVRDMMKLEKGSEILFEYDKKTDTIIIKKIKD